MWGIIEYLQDPYLVVRIQRFYGVRKYEPNVDEIEVRRDSYVKKDEKCFDERNISKSDGIHPVKHSQGSEGVSLRHNKCLYSDHEDVFSSDSETESKNYIITNFFWHYLFVFGTELGDEIFYATFIPFWFWNIDGAVGRRVVMVWTIIMYIGQGIKDIVCWPRPPSPPVFRLQEKWVQEYGMPSTHAMVGISIPFSVVLYTINRYQYPLIVGLFIATLWCAVMCISRLYLGMHSVLDVVVGLVLALLLMVPVVPLVDRLDPLILTSKLSPLFLFVISVSLIVFYPKGKGTWTPTRGDTTLIISVCVGVLIGAWANYQLGDMSEPTSSPPYNVIWPSYRMLGLGVLRTVIGMCCIVGTRALCKSILYGAFCYITSQRRNNFSENSKDNKCLSNKNDKDSVDNIKSNLFADLCHKYFTYMVIGFTTLYLLPNVFRVLHIERPTFYTEI